VTGYRVHLADSKRMAGFLDLERARVRWFLSVDPVDVPAGQKESNRTTYRSITIDGTEIDFTEGFVDLHQRVYEETLAGRGFGIEDSRPSIELVHRIRQAPVVAAGGDAHPSVAPKSMSAGRS
jgi:UDP-N-acetyl-2-amino-2-deoxyglucuronate dehydrogenase